MRLEGVHANLTKLVLLLVSSMLTLGVAELALRIGVGANPSEAGHHKLLCEHDPVLGWRKIAGANRRYITPEYDIHERINSKGLRGPELDYAKPSGVYRILVLGDSFTEGYTVVEDEIFTEVLRRDLETRWGAGAVEVVNGGTGGYSTDQELLFFRGEGRRYAPDLVILAFVENDVWYNAQPAYPRAPKPLFALRGGELVVSNLPVPELATAPDRSPAETPGNAWHRARVFLGQHSALYTFVRDRVKGTHWLHATAIGLGLADPPDDLDATIDMPDACQVFRREPTPAVEQAWSLTEALLRTLRDEVERSGARFMVVNVPPSFDLDPDAWRDIRRKYGLDERDWSASAVTRHLVDLCSRNRIDLYDLTPAFAAAIEAGEDRPEPLYFPIDGHWTARGHRLAGERIAEALLSHGIHPASVP